MFNEDWIKSTVRGISWINLTNGLWESSPRFYETNKRMRFVPWIKTHSHATMQDSMLSVDYLNHSEK